ncbi:MAG: dienelactone hydrolase family protein [Acidimicrobiales bacterium]
MRETLPSGTLAEVVRSEAPARGLLIAADIGGLRPLFDDMVARLAADHTWSVAAVEPFPGQESLTLEERMAAAAELDDERQVGDLTAAADLLGVEPVGVIGFCMGGMYAMKAAATGRFDRAVSFYGMIRVPGNWRGEAQRDALELLEKSGTADRVLAIIGTADPYTPAGEVADLEVLGTTVVRYEGAEHGFVHDPTRPAHRPDDAADAWRRMAEWMSRQ